MPEGSIRARKPRGSATLAETAQIPLDRVNGTPVEVDGESVIVGKLSILQITALAREILSASIRMTPEERRKLVVETRDMGNVAALLMVLDSQTISRLFSIVLNREEEWCGHHIGGLEALEIADAVLENNKWEQLQAVFTRLAKRFQRSPGNSASPSLDSPDLATANVTSASTPSNGSSASPETSASSGDSTSPMTSP